MFRSRQALLVACCAVGIGGCLDHSPLQPLAGTVVVHAVINADTSDQYVIVQEVDGGTGMQKEVTGATVSITAPDGRIMAAREVTDSLEFQPRYDDARVSHVYRVSLRDYGVAPRGGDVFMLRVVAPDGRTVTGSTTVPATPSATPWPTHVDSISIRADSVPVTWSSSTYASSYELQISYATPSYRSEVLRTFVDAPFVMTKAGRDIASLYAFENDFVNDVVVLAVDANYFDYYRKSSDLLGATGMNSHLTGGVGVFGSVTRVSQRRVLAVQR